LAHIDLPADTDRNNGIAQSKHAGNGAQSHAAARCADMHDEYAENRVARRYYIGQKTSDPRDI